MVQVADVIRRGALRLRQAMGPMVADRVIHGCPIPRQELVTEGGPVAFTLRNMVHPVLEALGFDGVYHQTSSFNIGSGNGNKVLVVLSRFNSGPDMGQAIDILTHSAIRMAIVTDGIHWNRLFVRSDGIITVTSRVDLTQRYLLEMEALVWNRMVSSTVDPQMERLCRDFSSNNVDIALVSETRMPSRHIMETEWWHRGSQSLAENTW